MRQFVERIRSSLEWRIIAGVLVGAIVVFILDHRGHIAADIQAWLAGPTAGILLPKLFSLISRKRPETLASIEDHITPEDRKKVKDDAITSNDQLQKQTEIQAKIERLLGAIDGADRVIIHKFHNGGRFYTEQSTQKMAVVYQASRYKYYKIDNELNGGNFNLEKMGGILKKVVDKRYLHLTMKGDKEKYKHTTYFQILEEDGVEANHLRIIRSGRETYRNIGLLSIHFIKRKKKGLSEREIRLIDETVRDIQLLLVKDLKGYPKHQI